MQEPQKAPKGVSSTPGTRSPSRGDCRKKGRRVVGATSSQDQVMSTEGKGSGGLARGENRVSMGGGRLPSKLGTGCPGAGKGVDRGCVSTLHCSSLDSVFLSPVHTLSLFQVYPHSEWLTFSHPIWVLPASSALSCQPSALTSLCPALSLSTSLSLSPVFSASHFSPALGQTTLDNSNNCL